ncbi:parathyroid hormone 4-like isoform X1 [Empidonax traillii]|uniref:parathyroid hormone 4-like isoform X1 n=1 Tax=Empidonax traillii TaxID=164674 RepID=UPI000FFD828C|nr:parathyroid hormone 4-like isoform X1 [Empidonax traillii]XP_027753243.1 parathyroid hormone 4-like isoform X1 [Empidonax traillii]XP_027753244.1 parathyroid hormone 4-like isoform X1 [Empidonax traillii]XP_027753245.1 parathyroid hormone 4-like isoform X1 [Empidonax traillii]
MFLPQRSLQTVTFLAILFFACFATCQEIENRRAVTEHQLMHDRGRAFQGLKRLMWLHNALGTVHTASSRDVPPPHATWDAQKSQDPSDLHSSTAGDETSSLTKLLGLTEAQGFLPLKQLDWKTPKGNWDPRGLFELLQTKEMGSKRNPSSQPQDYSR